MTLQDQQVEFAELLRAAYPRLLAFIRSLVLNPNDAQDVFQEAVLAMWQCHGAYDPQRDFGAWAIGLARNKVFDYYKARSKEKARLGDDVLMQLAERQQQSIESPEFLQVRQAALQACLAALTDRQTELVRRCYDGKETVRDVAKSLHRTAGSIYSSLRHIRMRLLECIEEKLSTEDGRG